MNTRHRAFAAVAALGAGAIALAGCSGGGGTGGGGDDAAIITTNGVEPQNPLIPTSTNEVGGGKILDLVFAGLVYYDVDGVAHNDMAEEIETIDASNYRVTVEEGNTFSNGEPVTAQSFVDAWNYGALASNDQLSSYFFEDIDGFSYDEDSELTGLTVTDEYTFEIALSRPASDFPQRLGYSAFFPLPEAAFDDMDAFGENPIGNGPYMLAEEGAWQHNVGIELVTNPDYSGERQPANDGVDITFFDSADAAYAELASGTLDVLDIIPDSQLATFEDQLGDRAINQPAAIFQSFTIPARLEHFSGEEGQLRREAISLAINREEITDVIFSGSRTPASDFTSPVVDGWSADVPGNEVLEYDPERAQELWAQADAIAPWTGSFQIAYNSDNPHQAWVDAVTNGLQDTLGIDASGAPYPTFAEVRTLVTDRQITTAFRSGWQADYPGLFNFLGPLYATNAGSNDGDYSSAEFDGLIQEGIADPDPAAANELFQQAQTVLMRDLPAVPLWYQNAVGARGENVDNVEFGWNSVPIYHEITRS